jgi:hypothetical protein
MAARLSVRRLKALWKEPSRLVDWLREPPQLVSGGAASNRLGLQVARTLVGEASWRLRGADISDRVRLASEVMERDGVFVMEDFLQPADFRSLVVEYERSRHEPDRQETAMGTNVKMEHYFANYTPERYPNAMRLLRDDAFLIELAAAVLRRKKTYRPHVDFYTVYRPFPEAPYEDLDSTQYPHPDRHFPTVKAFLYLADVNADDGPFSYAKGSHRMSLSRLRFDYEYSVIWTKHRSTRGRARGNAVKSFTPLLANCAETWLKNQGMSCDPIVGRANTLVVSNNRGLHKRGIPKSGHARPMVYMDFGYLNSRAQHFYPVLKHFYTHLQS